MGLIAGTYNLTLVVNDESGYSIVDTVIITVIEETTTATTTVTATSMTSTSSTISPRSYDSMIFIAMIAEAIGAVILHLFITIRKKVSCD